MAEGEKKQRVVSDCRTYEGDCSVTITGTEEEVVPIAAWHAINGHGETDSPELYDMIRSSLEPVHEEEAGRAQVDRPPAPTP